MSTDKSKFCPYKAAALQSGHLRCDSECRSYQLIPVGDGNLKHSCVRVWRDETEGAFFYFRMKELKRKKDENYSGTT